MGSAASSARLVAKIAPLSRARLTRPCRELVWNAAGGRAGWWRRDDEVVGFGFGYASQFRVIHRNYEQPGVAQHTLCLFAACSRTPYALWGSKRSGGAQKTRLLSAGGIKIAVFLSPRKEYGK
jgi:hypothetical protein